MAIDTEVIVYNQYSLWILHYWINPHFRFYEYKTTTIKGYYI